MLTLKEGNMIFFFSEKWKRSIAFLQTDAPFAALFFSAEAELPTVMAEPELI